MSRSRPFSFAIVAAGRVATAAGILLSRAGNRPVAVASRSPASAERAAHLLQTDVVPFDRPAPIGADLVIIGAVDSVIDDIVDNLADRVAESTVICHLSGSLGLRPLESWIDRGGDAAAIHPVQACPTIEAGVERLPGSAWGVTTTVPVGTFIEDVVRVDLHGDPVTVSEEARPVWHAASVTTSNGISALMAAGEMMLREIGIPSPERVLAPLAAGTLANALEKGGAAALTGPLVRGEIDTVRRHVAALTAFPAPLAAYRGAARLILDAATQLDAGTRAAALSALEGK